VNPGRPSSSDVDPPISDQPGTSQIDRPILRRAAEQSRAGLTTVTLVTIVEARIDGMEPRLPSDDVVHLLDQLDRDVSARNVRLVRDRDHEESHVTERCDSVNHSRHQFQFREGARSPRLSVV
jgi:hypothetical protein